MANAQWLGRRSLAHEAAAEDQQHLELWSLGTIALVTAMIEVLLLARIFVQLLGAHGFFADLAFLGGGLFLAPFSGDSLSASGGPAVFELQAVLAMTVYALAANIVAFLWLLFRAYGPVTHLLGAGARTVADASVFAYRTGAVYSRRATEWVRRSVVTPPSYGN
jgi:hypothetical protein